ncbi:MAG: hypothetical protein ACTHLH_06050 [Solirubrobacterales bacterium]
MADRQQETIADILERIGESAKPKSVKELPPERKARLEGDDLEELIKLKRFYGRVVLGLMTLQLVVVNAGFLLYTWKGYHWKPPDGVVQVWLTATFVQIVSVVVVITKSLFPGGRLEAEGLRASDPLD